MKYLLDTDTFTAMAKVSSALLMERVNGIGLDALALSVVTEGEVRYGQAHGAVSAKLSSRIDFLLSRLRRLGIDSSAVPPYAKLRAHLRHKGQPIGPNDCWIAAQALAADLTLVTGNEREFRRVPGLTIENWIR